MTRRWDAVVVGAGVVGLAHAFHLGRRGLSVLVVERSPAAEGASIRNFGMIWPVGQPAGERLQTALASRRWWLQVLADAGIWHEEAGSLHVACHPDEEAVLREFASDAARKGYSARVIPAEEAGQRAPRLRTERVRCALWSDTEVCIDPREAIRRLPTYLARVHGVAFRFGEDVQHVDSGRVELSDERIHAEHVFVCPGDAPGALLPGLMDELGLVRCKLQMMRSAPLAADERVGPMLAGGLTLAHYEAFEDCPSRPALVEGLAQRHPGYAGLGIHVMVSQNGRGELVIGDSHEYGEAIEPFDKVRIDELVLGYLRGWFRCDDAPIAARWHGTYAKHPYQPWVIARPLPGVHVVTGLSGAGMTLSFGLADKVVAEAVA